MVAADDLTVTVSGGVVANKPARIDTDGVVQRGRRVGVVVDVKLASLKVPPLAGRDLTVNGDCFCPAARVVAGRDAIRAGVAGETPGWVPGVMVGSAGGIGGFDDLVELVVSIGGQRGGVGGGDQSSAFVPGVAVDLAGSIDCRDEAASGVVTEVPGSGDRIPGARGSSAHVIVSGKGDDLAGTRFDEPTHRVPAVLGGNPGGVDDAS